jgi:hypothetical protein
MITLKGDCPWFLPTWGENWATAGTAATTVVINKTIAALLERRIDIDIIPENTVIFTR